MPKRTVNSREEGRRPEQFLHLGLAGELRPELEMQPFCKVNLIPGKASKQQASAVKRGRDATFNQVCRSNRNPRATSALKCIALGTKKHANVHRANNHQALQEFFFDPVTNEDIEAKSLHIEVCHQSTQKLQKDLVIGEIRVPLKDLTQLQSKKEVRIVEELKSYVSAKVSFWHIAPG